MGDVTRKRTGEETRRQPQRQALPPEGQQQLEEARRKAKALLKAGDDAIARALSGDSQEFLKANEQEGGQ